MPIGAERRRPRRPVAPDTLPSQHEARRRRPAGPPGAGRAPESGGGGAAPAVAPTSSARGCRGRVRRSRPAARRRRGARAAHAARPARDLEGERDGGRRHAVRARVRRRASGWSRIAARSAVRATELGGELVDRLFPEHAERVAATSRRSTTPRSARSPSCAEARGVTAEADRARPGERLRARRPEGRVRARLAPGEDGAVALDLAGADGTVRADARPRRRTAPRSSACATATGRCARC